jgi:regulator of protease activity HflC (stomatin/prohibitin superfamily)
MQSLMPVMTLICILAGLAWASIKRIPEGHAYTLRRFGGHMRTLGAGTHLVVPLLERVAHKINLCGNAITIAELPVGIQGERRLNGTLYFQVLDAERADGLIERVEDLLRQYTQQLLPQALEQDNAARDAWMKSELNRNLRDSGLLVTRVQLNLS